ncbi:hypothetical protein J6TS1_02450 [Siminovitchia terrae]|uniref:NAD(P)-binding domain-containing protein n=1 Tax=Siminovitchia terrae TaxID=1914933 RepID=A0ABQ4KQQ5_SIMTE|nr:NAD(P)H-binding protein [Siminovitchia terrae]GIN90108.1 hypothetical protein J22TS1_11590 [Siminovitchia terrae]GIN94375.1 hypothetical protein J6TS1_02450 [Siminovitchia terrae]
MTLYLRNSNRLRKYESDRVRIIEGDVRDIATLKEAIVGQDVVYANLAGDLEEQAKAIVEAMDTTGVKRLIFISSVVFMMKSQGNLGNLLIVQSTNI